MFRTIWRKCVGKQLNKGGRRGYALYVGYILKQKWKSDNFWLTQQSLKPREMNTVGEHNVFGNAGLWRPSNHVKKLKEDWGGGWDPTYR